MFVVIFEVQPKPERWTDYLDTAKLLRPEIEQIDGFVDNERFKSERTDGRVLSLSTWRDEKALVRWRTQVTHHTRGQAPGRMEIFADYHLRVGEITSDSAAPEVERSGGDRFDVTEVGAATIVTLTEVGPDAGEVAPSLAPTEGTPGLVDQEWFTSITEEGKRVLLVSWNDDQAARAFVPKGPGPGGTLRHREARIIRDYGMRDRREAPQYFPDVE
jgi:heme-degrading monooxygenase HmoA